MPTVATTTTLLFNVQVNVAIARQVLFNVQVNVSTSRVIAFSVVPPWSVTQFCSYIPGNDNPVFRRLLVDNIFGGGTRVQFDLNQFFIDPEPYIFQLQFSQSAGDANADDWTNIGNPQTNVSFLEDPLQRMYGKTQTASYRILLTTPKGSYISQPALVMGKLDEHGFLMIREVIRKETLRAKLFGSTLGYLLKARRYGTICDCVSDSGEITNSNHKTCFGTGWVGGYFKPLACSFSEITPEQSRESRNLQGTGTEKPVVVQGRFLGVPLLVQGDVFVSTTSDNRFYVHSVQNLAVWREVPVIQEVELRRAAFSDVIYSLPLVQP